MQVNDYRLYCSWTVGSVHFLALTKTVNWLKYMICMNWRVKKTFMTHQWVFKMQQCISKALKLQFPYRTALFSRDGFTVSTVWLFETGLPLDGQYLAGNHGQGPRWWLGIGWHNHWSWSCPVLAQAQGDSGPHTHAAEHGLDPHWETNTGRRLEEVI